MPYLLKIFTADDVSAADLEQASQRFKAALETSLGDDSLVMPVYHAYQKLWQTHGDQPRPWPVSPAEQLLAAQWEAAELEATQAAFGPHRYLGDADFELVSLPAADSGT